MPPRKKKVSRARGLKKRRASGVAGNSNIPRRAASAAELAVGRCAAIVQAQATKRAAEFLRRLGSGDRATGMRDRNHVELEFARYVFGKEEMRATRRATARRDAELEPERLRRLPTSAADLPFDRCAEIVHALATKRAAEFVRIVGNGEHLLHKRDRKQLEVQFARYVFVEKDSLISRRDPEGWRTSMRGTTPAQQRIRRELREAEAEAQRPGATSPYVPPAMPESIDKADDPAPSSAQPA